VPENRSSILCISSLKKSPRSRRPELPLKEVEPGEPLKVDRAPAAGEFRVIVRHWDDKFLERKSWDQMPSTSRFSD
jgi:hypothetical protein